LKQLLAGQRPAIQDLVRELLDRDLPVIQDLS
jgi:hypothetical protein